MVDKRPEWPTHCEPIPVIVQEPSGSGWWINNGEWGFQLQTTYPPTLQSVIPVLNNISLPGPPRMCSVSLYRQDRTGAEDFSAPRNAEIYAQIIYGSGGVSNTILVNWEQGGQLAIPCQQIRINAVPWIPDLAVGEGYSPRQQGTSTLAKLQLGCVIGINGVQASIPASFRTPQLALDPADEVAIPFPEFSRICVPLLAPVIGSSTFGNLADYTVRTLEGIGRTSQGPYVVDAQMVQHGFHINGRPGAVIIRNNGLVPAKACCKFLLGL